MKVGAVVSSISPYWTDLFEKLKIEKSSTESVELLEEAPMEFICSCDQLKGKNTVHYDPTTNEYVVRGACDLGRPCCAIAVDKHRLKQRGLYMLRVASVIHPQSEGATMMNDKKEQKNNALTQLEQFLM